MLTTDQKGAVAELAIAGEAVKLGVGVYRPLVEGGRYDLILDVGTTLVRTQCKWAPLSHGAVVVRCYSARRGPDRMIMRSHTSAETDAIAAYCLATDGLYLLTPSEFAGRRHCFLRVAASRNTSSIGSTGRTTSTSPLD